MNAKVEWQESDDPWRGRQPKYHKLVMRGPDRFFLATQLPSGRRIMVRLDRFDGDPNPEAHPPGPFR